MRRALWYVYRYCGKARKSREIDTVRAVHQPEALGKAFKIYGAKADLFVRRHDERLPAAMLAQQVGAR